ncbi:unnamed protein product [Darwinula stevensoni]|uniref:Uncharacterized protein n=1 Tax=Darwinula stevensoni TaxID=69355 RepID=A0A7R8X4X9_9CRUS|nr:unnamed protein product [Darwinula stevensoni]CAG0886543.1 unnamed protein product [Darwinula stevensoni]
MARTRGDIELLEGLKTVKPRWNCKEELEEASSFLPKAEPLVGDTDYGSRDLRRTRHCQYWYCKAFIPEPISVFEIEMKKEDHRKDATECVFERDVQGAENRMLEEDEMADGLVEISLVFPSGDEENENASDGLPFRSLLFRSYTSTVEASLPSASLESQMISFERTGYGGPAGRVRIKVYRGPSDGYGKKSHAPWGYWVKQPADRPGYYH